MSDQIERTRIGIHGAAGRMGRRLVALGSEDAQLDIACAIERDGHSDLGCDAGELAGFGNIGVPLSSEINVEIDALIDFSTADAVPTIVAKCVERQIPLVLATTGFSADEQAQIVDAGQRIPIVMAPNMSLAVNLTMKLASLAAEKLTRYGPGTDVEIIERHHRFKEDAPSGTALRFGELISNQMGQTQHTHGRRGRPGQRPPDEIGYHALRTGDNPGEHTIVFGMLGESLELTVRATSRDSYALGALEAAKFLTNQSPGIYSMDDVLGL